MKKGKKISKRTLRREFYRNRKFIEQWDFLSYDESQKDSYIICLEDSWKRGYLSTEDLADLEDKYLGTVDGYMLIDSDSSEEDGYSEADFEADVFEYVDFLKENIKKSEEFNRVCWEYKTNQHWIDFMTWLEAKSGLRNGKPRFNERLSNEIEDLFLKSRGWL